MTNSAVLHMILKNKGMSGQPAESGSVPEKQDAFSGHPTDRKGLERKEYTMGDTKRGTVTG